MNRTKGAGSAAGKFFVFVLVFLLLLSVAGVSMYFIAKEKGMNFYVSYDGKKYYARTESAELYLPPSVTAYTFGVKTLTGGETDYSVKVTSNPANNFAFVTGDEYWKFYDTDETKNDYTDMFQVTKQAGGFTLTVPEGFQVADAVAEQFGCEIEMQSELSADKCYFVITVTAGGSNVNLSFATGYMLYIDPPRIVF